MKKFFLDTSVILDSMDNIQHLSEGGKNKIFISETVIKELNGHKEDILNEKGYIAREFARNLDRSEQDFNLDSGLECKDGDVIIKYLYNDGEVIIPLYIISRKKYKEISYSNDLKLIEIAESYNQELVTNDIYLKLEAITRGVKSSSLKRGRVENPENINFSYTLELESFESIDSIYKKLIENFSNLRSWSQITITYKTTNRVDYFITTKHREKKSKHRFKKLSETDIAKLYRVQPINNEQKFYAEMMSSEQFEIGIATGSTGSGKTLLALEEGVRRVKDKNSPINGIVYMRNTVTANDSASEMGFRKGDQDQKLGYFAYPLFGAINFIINNSGKRETDKAPDKTTKEEITEGFMKKHNIEVMDIAHARGITISNKWVIFDELQNATSETLKLIGTRIGKNSKMIMLGDFKQVDHPYLTKTRNGLVSMLKLAVNSDEIAAIQLKKTIRSRISEWFDKNL